MNSVELQGLLDRLWQDFASITPEAQRVGALISARGDPIVHRRLALRTLDHPKLGIEASARAFEALGYCAAEDREAPDEPLRTRRYEAHDADLPDAFISELQLAACTRGLRDIVASLMRQFEREQCSTEAFVTGGLLWNPVMRDTYERLLQESEHAAWVAAFGFRVHHFALSVDQLDSFESLDAFNAFLRSNGIELDDSADEIEDAPTGLFEHSATRPARCPMCFADGNTEVRGGQYRFMWRHALPGGHRFPGLAAAGPEAGSH